MTKKEVKEFLSEMKDRLENLHEDAGAVALEVFSMRLEIKELEKRLNKDD